VFNNLSLTRRVLLAVSIVLTAFLGLSAFSLNNAFTASAETAQQKRLKNFVYSILSAIEFSEDGKIQLSRNLSEPAFTTPNSGLYAQITTGNEIVWQSESMLGRFIALPEHPGASNEKLSVIEMEAEENLINLAFGIVWVNNADQEFEFTINVSENLSAIQSQKIRFRYELLYSLGGTGLILLIMQALILRWSLRPLYSAADDLHAIESGDKQRLDSDYPKELERLTQNINALLDHEQSRRERYKNSLADLAHSLKTPLAVFRGEVENSKDINEIQHTAREQLDRINTLVSYQLKRAATEGQSSLLAPVSLAQIVHKIAGTLDKVYADKQVQTHFELDNGYVHADKGDMYELIGNLIENAYKYCSTRVDVVLFNHPKFVEIRIEDDGKGIPEHAYDEVIKRGKRIDTQIEIEGQGLGLAIVKDIIEAYHGHITVRDSYLGGACFVIEVPIH
jgi:two-component system sensor histidine kinase PhoQ